MEGFPMADTNYDIWAIQNNPEEVYQAVAGLENSQDNLLYNNLRSSIRVGDRKLQVRFDTALFCGEEERLILLMKNGKLSREEFKSILIEKNIPFNEITFLETQPVVQDDLKEIWFAVDRFVLDEALLDSRSKGIDVCEYYPDLGGVLELRFLSGEGRYQTLHKQPIRGAMLLDDKIVLLLSQSHKRGIKFQQALTALYGAGMTPQMVVGEKELPLEQLPKQYIKEQ